MSNDLSEALEAGLNRLDKSHRRRIHQEAMRYEIFDERIDSFVKEAGTILYREHDFNKLLYVPEATIEGGRGTIAYGELEEDPYIQIGRHDFDMALDDSPFQWQRKRGLSTTKPNPQYEQKDEPGDDSPSEEWKFLNNVIGEVFTNTEKIISVFIMNLQFDEIRVVPAYKRSIFEGRLFFTARVSDPRSKKSAMEDIQKEYRKLQEDVEGEEFEEAFKSNEVDL